LIKKEKKLNYDRVGELMYAHDKCAVATSHAQYIRKVVSDKQQGEISPDKFQTLEKALEMPEGTLWAYINSPKQSHLSIHKPLTEEESEFCEFFGAAVFDTEKPVQLLMPKRSLADWVLQNPKSESPFAIEEDCIFEDAGDSSRNVWAEGVGGYLAFDNACAAMHLTNVIVQKTRHDVWMRQENGTAFNECLATNSCFISFGLGFSAATRLTERHFVPRLFTVHSIPMAMEHMPNCLTDTFRIKGGGGEGRDQSTKEIPIPNGKDIALIIRVVPADDAEEATSPYFICSGRTAPGTEAAGYFLAYRWSELMDLYPNKHSLSKHSLAVVIQHNKPREPRRDIRIGRKATFMESASIHTWDAAGKEPCIAFGVYGPES
jgi:hypothetical protein